MNNNTWISPKAALYVMIALIFGLTATAGWALVYDEAAGGDLPGDQEFPVAIGNLDLGINVFTGTHSMEEVMSQGDTFSVELLETLRIINVSLEITNVTDFLGEARTTAQFFTSSPYNMPPGGQVSHISGDMVLSFSNSLPLIGPETYGFSVQYADYGDGSPSYDWRWTIETARNNVFFNISPPSGHFASTQGFDLTLILETPDLSIVGGNAVWDGVDVTSALVDCVIPGKPASGGQTLRCPGLTGGLLGTGRHTLEVALDLSDGSTVTDSVTWNVKENTEP